MPESLHPHRRDDSRGHERLSRVCEVGRFALELNRIPVDQTTRFLTIYSGRLGDSETGRVWHPRVVHELLERAAAASQ